jgi:hypothetical protein
MEQIRHPKYHQTMNAEEEETKDDHAEDGDTNSKLESYNINKL